MSNSNSKKVIAVTGATGFVGRKLTLALIKNGYQVRVLTRNVQRAQKTLSLPVEFFAWSPESEAAPVKAIDGAYAVVHLAGEGIADGRWTPRRKKALYDSRIVGTKNLVESMKRCTQAPQIFVSTSAIGVYGDRLGETLTESSSGDQSFLSKLCQDWELEAFKAPSSRIAILRTGIVLGQDGGALAKMLLPFKIGAGGPLSTGKQWMSWIHVDDHVRLYLEAIENPNFKGPINAVSPQPVTNAEFTKSLSKALGMPALVPTPAFALKLVFGEMSTVLLSSQRVSASKLQELNFHFKFKNLDDAMTDLLRPSGHRGAYIVTSAQWVKEPRELIFKFFSDAKNLERISPPWINFRVQKMSTPAIAQGTLIDYKLKIHGFPIRWRTLIDSWQPGSQFVDTQLKGPYSLWHHTHSFSDLNGGTMIEDRVVYRLPFWILGDIVREFWVKHDIKSIFGFRQKVIEDLSKANFQSR